MRNLYKHTFLLEFPLHTPLVPVQMFTLNNHFLWQRDKSVYLTAGGKTFVHEDEGYFSYDTARKLVLWDQVHSGGLVTPAGSKLKLSNENRSADKSATVSLRA